MTQSVIPVLLFYLVHFAICKSYCYLLPARWHNLPESLFLLDIICTFALENKLLHHGKEEIHHTII